MPRRFEKRPFKFDQGFEALSARTAELGSLRSVLMTLSEAARASALDPKEWVGFETWVAQSRGAAWAEHVRDATRDPLHLYIKSSRSSLVHEARHAPMESGVAVLCDAMARAEVRAETLESVCALMTDRKVERIRTGRVGSVAGDSDDWIEYVAPEYVLNEVAKLCRVMNEKPARLESALVLLVATLITHPFDDGNGRTARAIFVAQLIVSGALPAACFPLGPLSRATEGSFRICIGRAELLNDWAPLIAHLQVLAEVSIDLVREYSKRKKPILA